MTMYLAAMEPRLRAAAVIEGNSENVAGPFFDPHWAAGDQLPLMLDGPEFPIANCTLQAGKQRFLVHLVNYNTTETPTIGRQEVRVVLPQNKKAQKITLYAPDLNDARTLNFANDGSNTYFTIPEMKTYAVIAIDW